MVDGKATPDRADDQHIVGSPPEANPAKNVSYPKPKAKVAQKAITEPQFLEIIAAHKTIQREKIRSGKRRGLHPWFRVAASLGFYAGLRRSEIVSMKWERVRLHDGLLQVTDTKNGRERAIPIQRPLAELLKAWQRLLGFPRMGLVIFKTDAPASHRGRKHPVTRDNLTKVFKEYARAADMPEAVTLHGLRHSFVTEMLRRGFNINEVADMAGHQSIEVTRRNYEHLDVSYLRSKMNQLGL